MTRNQGGDPLHVLLVEDNPGDVRLIREAIEENDIDTSLTSVTDGEEALDYLRRQSGSSPGPDIDLVFLDLNVPRVDGRSILEEIRTELDLTVPVCVLTGSESQNEIGETHALGADGHFIKPSDPHEFISLVQSVTKSLVTSGEIPPGRYADIDRDE